jgi:Holliday junction resolvase RusA-like endonuclease
MKITVPNPPTTNQLYTNRKGGRAKTKRYMTWLEAAAWHVRAQKPESVSGPVTIVLEIGKKETTVTVTSTVKTRPRGVLGDQDNYTKAIFDLLGTKGSGVGIIDDDRMVQAHSVRWGK